VAAQDPLRRVPEGCPMTFCVVLLALTWAFLLVAYGVEWTTARLKRPAPYRDGSRGTRRG
jgi:hypothetical protein